MKKYIFISILILTLTVAHKQATAQSKVWQWANSAGRYGDDYGNSVCTDASGNVYVTGYFLSDSINFGGIILHNANKPWESLWADIFLVKYDASGKVLWAKRAGGTGSDWSNSVSTDAFGNVYITGTFNSNSMIIGTDTLTNAGGKDIFLAKFDSLGNSLWAKSVGGIGRDYSNSVSADAFGSVYVTGYFDSDTITFGTTILTNIGSNNIFLTKYDASGKALWAKKAIGGSSLSTDASGNVYVTGTFSSKSTTIGTITLTNAGSAGSADIFLAKCDTMGNFLWAKSAGGNSNDYATSVTNDAFGNVYVTGHFISSSITFGATTLTKNGVYDIFLAKYNSAGKVLWAKKAGGTGYDYANSVSADNLGHVYIAGSFGSKSIPFGTDTLKNTNSTGSTGNYDFFLAKYDTSGNILLAKSAGGTDDNSSAGSVSADAFGNVYVTGTFSSKSITFGTNTVYNSFRYDIFLAKLGMCSNSASSKNVTTCGSFFWNNKAYTVSGTYKDTIANAAGCDSIMTLNLKILALPIVTLVLNPDTVLISTKPFSLEGGEPLGGTYSGPGVSNGDFDPSVAGVGLHIIKYTYDDVHGCSDSTTAQIFVYKNTGIETGPGFKTFVIYPNPFSVQAVLEFDQSLQNAMLTVKNTLGQTVKEIKYINGQTVILPRGNLACGLYFVHLTQDNNIVATQKILITD